MTTEHRTLALMRRNTEAAERTAEAMERIANVLEAMLQLEMLDSDPESVEPVRDMAGRVIG